MTLSPFVVVPLGKQARSDFDCKSEALNRYFHHQAGQDMRRRMAACYIAEDRQTNAIAGFYTLSSADIPVKEAPDHLTKRLPRYPTVPVARLGRLAVDHRYQDQKLGSALLADAALRTAQSPVAAFEIIVDAIDENAVAFYQYHGFVAYGSLANQLIAPLNSLLPVA